LSEIFSVHSLSTALRAGQRIVDNVSLSINHGETFALLGESGCGKSMTALSLMRLLPDGVRVQGGAARLGGVDLLSLPEREMRAMRGGKLAMIFQEPGLSLNPVMTVGQQIAEAIVSHQGLRGTEASTRGVALLQQVGIPDPSRRWDEYPFQMSGGMKQRVMIAMALAGRPEMLIADEPTTALDVTIQAQVLQVLRDMQRDHGMAMLLITHDLGVVAQMAHRVAVMYAGHIVELAPRRQLFDAPAHPYTRKLFAALPDAARRGAPLDAIRGTVPTLAEISGRLANACRFAPRCDFAWDLCREQAPAWTVAQDGRGVRCHLYEEAGRDRREGVGMAGGKHGTEGAVAAAAVFPSRLPHSAASPALLQVVDLRVHFPIQRGVLQRTVGHVRAVDGVSMAIGAGRTLALVGESGCGKTTAGKALLQLLRPTAGSVRFGGRELTGLDAKSLRLHRAGMQMVFQDPYASLNPRMRVAEILQEGMDALGAGGNAGARQQAIDALLAEVGLDAAVKWRYPHEFSGGQRQRIAIARALAVSPRLLICDEPTSALDVSVQAQILNLLKSLQQKLELSYLFITHNLAVVEYLAHDVCVMYLGRIVERGTAEEVLRAPKHPYTQALLAAVPHVDGRGMETVRAVGDLPSPSNPPPGCHFHPRCPHVMAVCREVYPGATPISSTQGVHCHLYAGHGADSGSSGEQR
jgi:peptide/nickel transport system ATP-binding protein